MKTCDIHIDKSKLKIDRSTEDRFDEFMSLAEFHGLIVCMAFDAIIEHGHCDFDYFDDDLKEEYMSRFGERLSIAMALPRFRQ